MILLVLRFIQVNFVDIRVDLAFIHIGKTLTDVLVRLNLARTSLNPKRLFSDFVLRALNFGRL